MGDHPTFIVDATGQLSAVDHERPVTRYAAFFIPQTWKQAPEALCDLMEDCLSLEGMLADLYEHERLRLLSLRNPSPSETQFILKRLPEDPAEGLVVWLTGLSPEEFAAKVVPDVEAWLCNPPDIRTDDESDFIAPHDGYDMAYRYFLRMPMEAREQLGIEITSGGESGYEDYSARLDGSPDAANQVARSLGLPVRFCREAGTAVH